MVKGMFEKDEEKKKELQATFATETVPNFIKSMEAALVKNGGEYFAGKDVRGNIITFYKTISDYFFFDLVDLGWYPCVWGADRNEEENGRWPHEGCPKIGCSRGQGSKPA